MYTLENKWKAFSVIALGTFMMGLNASMFIIALPTIMFELNIDLTMGVIILSVLRLVSVMLLVTFGRASDMFGRTKLYLYGLIFYTIGSGLCAAAMSSFQLLFFRIIQGIGGALLIVNSVAIVIDVFPKKEVGFGLGLYISSLNVGNILGYASSGFILTMFNWRVIFLVNVPIGIIGIIWATRNLSTVNVRSSPRSFDIVGAILYSIGALLLMIALSLGSVFSYYFLILTALGIFFFIIFWIIEKHVKSPIIDFNIFRIRSFVAGNISNMLNVVAFIALPFLLTLYLQLVWELDIILVGLLFMTIDMTRFLVAAMSGKLADKYNPKAISIIAIIIMTFSFIYLSQTPEQPNIFYLVVGLFLVGLGRGMFIAPNTSFIMRNVPPDRRGVANGIRSTFGKTITTISAPLAVTLMSFFAPANLVSQAIMGTIDIALKHQLAFAICSTYVIFAVIIAPAVIPLLLHKEDK